MPTDKPRNKAKALYSPPSADNARSQLNLPPQSRRFISCKGLKQKSPADARPKNKEGKAL